MFPSNSNSRNNNLYNYKVNNHQDVYSIATVKSSSSSAATQSSYCQNCKNYHSGTFSFSLCNECGENSNNGFPTEDFHSNEIDNANPIKLIDAAAKVVALHYPFQSIEERYERIPEPVQRRIIYWSFPQEEKDIIMYSSLKSDEQKVSFNKGQSIYQNDLVHNVLQVGFHLSGTINYKSSNYYQSGDSSEKYRVSITFDRCKITSVTCSCDTKDIFWCPHVVALALYRIRNPNSVRLRVPISETLLQLDKYQLQKLVQFLISEHHTEVLPTAQSLADKMLNRNSILNAIKGAPDPTAGAAIEQENCWHLDLQQITKKVTVILGYDCAQLNKQMNALFAKVKEMLKARDSNASRMLRLITEQFLHDRRLAAWRLQGPMSEKWIKLLWDQLAEIWVYIALNPNASFNERKKISDLLFSWTQSPTCPFEDENQRSTQFKHRMNNDNEDIVNSDDEFMMLDNEAEQSDELIDNNNNNYNFNDKRRRSLQNSSSRGRRKKKRYLPLSIFHRALEASFLKWDDAHLRYIIGENYDNEKKKNFDQMAGESSDQSKSKANSNKLFDSNGHPLWHESIPIACARVEALRCHGYETAALKLAVAVVRSMKKKQRESIEMLKKQTNKSTIQNTTEGWIGNQLDSISTLFDTLAEASLTQESKPLDNYYGMFLNEFNNYAIPSSLPLEVTIPPASVADFHESFYANSTVANHTRSGYTQRPKPKYQAIQVQGSHNKNETYISFALEAALIGLGQQRIMPHGEYLQERALTQEERLITKLSDIEFDHKLISVLGEQAMLLLDGGPYSGLGLGIHPESVPMHSFARYLFMTLLQCDPELAYLVGLRAMRLPILEGFNNYFEDLNNNNSSIVSNNNRRLNGNNYYNYLFPNLLYSNLNNNQLYPSLSNHNHSHHPYNPSYNRSHSHHHHHNRSNGANLSVNSANTNSNSWQRWHIIHRIEYNQCLLAITMISAARNDFHRLKSVQKAAQKHIHTHAQLFRLARETFSIAIPTDPNATNNNCSNNNLNGNTAAPLNSLHNSSALNQPNHQSLPFYNNNLAGNLSNCRTVNHSVNYSNALLASSRRAEQT